MKTLNEIRNEYLAQNEFDLSDLTYNDTVEMFDTWLIFNPMPEITDLDSFDQAVKKAMWTLYADEARTYFLNEEFTLNVKSCKWSIEQAILNRDSGKTMLHAALDYSANITR